MVQSQTIVKTQLQCTDTVEGKLMDKKKILLLEGKLLHSFCNIREQAFTRAMAVKTNVNLFEMRS